MCRETKQLAQEKAGDRNKVRDGNFQLIFDKYAVVAQICFQEMIFKIDRHIKNDKFLKHCQWRKRNRKIYEKKDTLLFFEKNRAHKAISF